MTSTSKIEKFFIKKSSQIQKQYVLSEVVQSFVTLVPIFMIGAFVLVLQNFPISIIADYISSAFGGLIYEGLGYVYDATYGMIAVYILVVLSLKYSVALTKGFSSINVLSTITSVAAYFILIAGDVLASSDGMNIKIFLQDYTSAKSVFMATVVAIVATKITLKINEKYVNKDNRSNAHADFTKSIKSMAPMTITLALFFTFAIAIKGLTGYNHVGELFVEVVNKPFLMLGKTVFSGMLVVFVENIVWFFGLHGANTFTELTELVFPESGSGIFSKTFLDAYTTLSGSGVTIGLVVSSLIFIKDKEQRKIMKLSLASGIFNINEMVVFGIPVVLNLPLIIPFILAPMASFFIAYVATTTGLVPMITNTVQWTTPPVVGGYLATGSWKGAALQLVIILVSILIYVPFVKLYAKVRNTLYEENIEELTEIYVESTKNNRIMDFTKLPDKLLRVVDRLGQQLQNDAESDSIDIYYQPQHNSEHKVVSSEALLRWKADTHNPLYPLLVVAIGKEFKVHDKVTRHIIDKALSDAVKIYLEIGEYFPVSVNVDVSQLLNEEFSDWVISEVEQYGIPKGTLGLEITEQEDLVGAVNLGDALDKFREHGIIVSIDDFSMGYTSLAYLQMNQFDYIKLDGGIVKNLEKNDRSKDVVDSLITLGKNLGFEVVAEYVENENLKGMLEELGCDKYQGNLYSPAVSIDEYISYIKENLGIGKENSNKVVE